MNVASIDNEIKKFLPLLDTEQKRLILSDIRKFLTADKKRKEREEYLIQYNKDLDEADKDILEGNVISHEDLKKQAENW